MDAEQRSYGAMLRRRREELGLTLDDLATRTRIRKTYLQALEQENLQTLPGNAYVVGFLRIYARQLGLSEKTLLEALPGRVARCAESGAGTAGENHRSGHGKTPGKKAGGRLLFLLLVLLLSAGGYAYFRFARAGASPSQTPPAAVVSPTVVQPSPPPMSQPTPAAPVPAGSDAQVPAIIDLPMASASRNAIRMVAIGTGIVKVALDGQETREYPLQPGQVLNWKVTRTLAVEQSVPGLVKIQIEDQEVATGDQPTFLLRVVAR